MSSWKNLQQAAAYLGPRTGGRPRSPRWVRSEIKAGKLRGAQLGGRGDWVTCDAWLDEYVESQVKPLSLAIRRRG